ncbi:MAG: transcriptional regulator [Deltaproteobacteria bacterium CG07_land_8_20_14_0_80_38_7]|nr:MAG: transcriptional regulator [Deltaproteobacteria bacterium CG07_land_8_20_14_0_80_38_7]
MKYVEYHDDKAVFDFHGNVIKGHINSRTATKLIREWIDLHTKELEEDWKLAVNGKEIKKINPLD